MSRPYPLIIAMAASVIVVAAAAVWDVERDYQDSMSDFSHELVAMAGTASHALSLGLQGQAHLVPADFLAPMRALERPGHLAFFVVPPGSTELHGSEGETVTVDALNDAIRAGDAVVPINRDDAGVLGLPRRIGIAAISRVPTRDGDWKTVVASSASSRRDRMARARVRLVVSVLVPGALIVFFGLAVLRRQRRELELTRELALADAQRAGDERLARANRAATTGTLAMGIAHEISTPLGTIIGRAEQLLSRVKDDERSSKAAQMIVEQANHINQVIRGILDLAHGGVPKTESVQPEELMSRAAALVEHRLAKAGVSLTHTITGELPAVRVNPQLFEHALVNLLLNSCDASKAGDVIHAHVSHDEHGVHFVIVDSGIGISAEDAARAIEPFFTTKPMGAGTGLGLAIANEVVKSHRGTLQIEPGARGGTEARIRIPAEGTA